MKDNKKNIALVVASADVFDFLKEKTGERKTRTEAYCDLLDKSLAGFVSEFLRHADYDLRPNQCHVTISDLAAEWHWHRATVRSFLTMLEELGQLEKIKLPKSIVITMPAGFGKALSVGSGRSTEDFDLTLDSALSGWVIGKLSSFEAAALCEQIIREYIDKVADPSSGRPSENKAVQTEDERGQLENDLREKAMACMARAALVRVLRKARFGDIAPIVEFFRCDLDEEWASLIELFKGLAELLVEGDSDSLDDTILENSTLKEVLQDAFHSMLARKEPTV